MISKMSNETKVGKLEIKISFHFNKHCDRDILKLDCVAD